MQRIATGTKAVDLFGSGKHGFQDGSSPGVDPTDLNAKWFNGVQEELVGPVEVVGRPLNTYRGSQLAGLLQQLQVCNLEVVSPAGGYSDPFRAVAAGGGWVVAVGDTGGLQGSNRDGRGWAALTPAGGYTGDFRAVLFFNGKFYAFGEAGEIQSATPGGPFTWSAESAAGSADFNGACLTGNDILVAVGASGTIETSPNGSTWTARTAGSGFTGTFYAVASNADGSVIVAVGAAQIQRSTNDGATWTQVSTASGNFTGVCWDGRQFIAVNSGGTVCTSADGVTWASSSPFASGFAYTAVYDTGHLTIALSSTYIAITDDGVNWIERGGHAVVVAQYALTWTGSAFVVVGNAGLIGASLRL